LALDPQSVEAQTRLAGSLVGLRVINGTNDLAAAGRAPRRAVRLSILASHPLTVERKAMLEAENVPATSPTSAR